MAYPHGRAPRFRAYPHPQANGGPMAYLIFAATMVAVYANVIAGLPV